MAAASTTETLLATAAITVGAANFVAGDILAYSNGAWVKIINLGDKAHTIPANSIGENQLTSGLRTKLQNLLTTGDVDHEIVAKTEGYGLKGTTDRIPEKRLPLKADNFLDALSGGTWSDSTTAKVAIVSAANPANIEQEPFATQLSGPRYTNLWYAIELPENDSLSLRRIAVGDSDNYWQLLPASAWTEREHDGGFRYYTIPFADLPASSVVRVQELTPFELDHEVLGLTEFTETQRDGLIALLDNPLPVPSAQQVGYVPKVGANRRYALEKEVRVGGTKLLSGPGAGIAIVTHTASRRDTFNLFRPTGGQSVFDLDAAGQDRDRFLFVSACADSDWPPQHVNQFRARADGRHFHADQRVHPSRRRAGGSGVRHQCPDQSQRVQDRGSAGVARFGDGIHRATAHHASVVGGAGSDDE